jgi:hypothetical protein
VSLADALTLLRLAGDLDRFLGRRLTPEGARALIRERLQARQERFLAYVSRYVFGYPRSPYLPLLRLARIDEPRLRELVQAHGLEGTLARLRDAGVYVSYEEFKGLTPVVRGHHVFPFTQLDFDNPFRGAKLRVLTGQSRSRGAPVHVALNTIAENRAVCFSLMLQAAGLAAAPLVTWLPGFPSGSGFFLWLGLSHIGCPPRRWLAMTDPARRGAAWHQRTVLPLARWIGRRHGLALPRPEFVPLTGPGTVLEALLAERARAGRVGLVTTPSAAVRVAHEARQRGVALDGVHCFVGSEPLTPGKAEEIRRAGAGVSARYIFTEGGAAGVGCGAPEAPDDMHFLADSFALIPHPRAVEGVGRLECYMLTSLLRYGPKVMLNVEIDDFGEMRPRRCGCPLDGLGLDLHLSGVRSFTKLTGEGAKVLGTNVVQVLEEVLPREFGGSSVDYQLLEAEDDSRITRLYLLINPDLPVDAEQVRRRFVAALSAIPYSGMSHTWFQTQTIRVLRRRPVATPSGKVLPFHTQAWTAGREQVAAESVEGRR